MHVLSVEKKTKFVGPTGCLELATEIDHQLRLIASLNPD